MASVTAHLFKREAQLNMQTDTRNALSSSAIWCAVLLGAVGLCAFALSWAWACGLACALLVAVYSWTSYHHHKLLATLSNTDLDQKLLLQVPDAAGLWGEVFYKLHRLNRTWSLHIQMLTQQTRDFEGAIQASPNAFILLNDAGCIVWINASAKLLLGLDPQRDVGQNLAFLLRTPAVAALLQTQHAHEPLMLAYNDRHVLIQSFPYGDAQVLLLGQDHTDIVRTDAIRRDFVANVSHELRTPLTVLMGYSELLKDHIGSIPQSSELPVGITSAVDHIATHAQRMHALTQDLLQLASLEAQSVDALRSQAEPIHVGHWVQEVCTQLRDLAPQVSLSCELGTQAEVTVLGQLNLLHSALSNLVANAMRYTPADGSVIVRIETSSDHCSVHVIDTGCGIAAHHIPRLTERFYRVSESRSRDSGGTGLGLAIVKHIMMLHGGELLMSSALGLGSRFSLVLPRK